MQTRAVIPPRSNRKQQRDYDRTLYKLRNRIERCFSKLSSSAALQPATKSPKPASQRSSPSPAHGSSCCYMSIRPRDGMRARARIYWHNKTDSMAADVPSEARLNPDQWGLFKFSDVTK